MLIHKQENDLAIPDALKFKAELRPLAFADKEEKKWENYPIDRHQALVRDDTDEPLAIVGNRYEPTQYYDIALKQMQGLEKSGLLKQSNFICYDYLFDNGARWKRDVCLTDLTIEPKVGDLVQFNQTAKSSHDGSLCNTTDSTPKRLSCANGCLSAIWQLIFRFRHTQNFDVENLVTIFNASTEHFYEMEPYFKSMGTTKISVKDVELALKQTICKRRKTKKKNIDHKEKLLGWLIGQYKKEAQTLDNTVWAFYNALTNWATHPELYDYKEDAKMHNLVEDNSNKVLLFLQSPQWDRIAFDPIRSNLNF